MKKVEAISSRSSSISSIGVQDLTMTEVKGFGRQKGYKELYRDAQSPVDSSPR